MTKYRVNLLTVLNCTVTVEAEDEAAALEAAFEEAPAEVYGTWDNPAISLNLNDWSPSSEGFTVEATPAVEALGARS